jgi:hypothetical protein
MPTDHNRDKGPTVAEFVVFWIVIVSICILLAWYKGHLI